MVDGHLQAPLYIAQKLQTMIFDPLKVNHEEWKWIIFQSFFLFCCTLSGLTLASFSILSSSIPFSLLPFRARQMIKPGETQPGGWTDRQRDRKRRHGKKKTWVWTKSSSDQHTLLHKPLKIALFAECPGTTQITFLSEHQNTTEKQPPGCYLVLLSPLHP